MPVAVIRGQPGPIDRTVRALPRQTLAAVAEELVQPTIMRQRVSADDVDTVGGDIDVAVISRAEGFVWARRGAAGLPDPRSREG